MDSNTSNSSLNADTRAYEIHRYEMKPTNAIDDPVPEYMNLLAMVFSMCGLMMKIKWCAWCAVFCSLISFSNSRSSEDSRQVLSSFMLSVSAVVMTYLQNPAPMALPF